MEHNENIHIGEHNENIHIGNTMRCVFSSTMDGHAPSPFDATKVDWIRQESLMGYLISRLRT
jgi:hypothetical protein